MEFGNEERLLDEEMMHAEGDTTLTHGVIPPVSCENETGYGTMQQSGEFAQCLSSHRAAAGHNQAPDRSTDSVQSDTFEVSQIMETTSIRSIPVRDRELDFSVDEREIISRPDVPIQSNEVETLFVDIEETSVNQTTQDGAGMTSVSGNSDRVISAEIIDDTVMTHNNRSSSESPSPSTMGATPAAADTSTPSGNKGHHRLPDVVSSHTAGAERKPSFGINNFYCFSSPSKNLKEICASACNDSCPKRSALIFPELMADVGGCLCTRTSRTQQQITDTPALCTMLPDLIVTEAEVTTQDPALASTWNVIDFFCSGQRL